MFFFKKKKKEITPAQLMTFVDKVVVYYGGILETDKNNFKRLSTLAYPLEIIKANLKLHIVHHLSDNERLNIVSTSYMMLADFVDDAHVPNGPDLITLAEKHTNNDDASFDNFTKDFIKHTSSINEGLELMKVLDITRKKLLNEITIYIKDIESLNDDTPSNKAIMCVAKEMSLVKNYIVKKIKY